MWEICNNGFVRMQNVNHHKLIHSGPKVLVWTKYGIKFHNWTHRSKYHLGCDACDWSMRWECNLKRHKLTDGGE